MSKNKWCDHQLHVTFYVLSFLDMVAHLLIGVFFFKSMNRGQAEKEEWNTYDKGHIRNLHGQEILATQTNIWRLIYMLENCEYFFALCIGIVLMTEMGQLAINLYASVREYLSIDNHSLICSKFSYKC